jgi:hypothetical protein
MRDLVSAIDAPASSRIQVLDMPIADTETIEQALRRVLDDSSQ